MALRGPGAGGFTPPQSLAASNPCLNCGTNIQLTYCPECGQREIDSDPTLREFAHELAEEFLHWDGKLFKTFRLLVTRPGELTCEYLAGKRVRYISPLRVYLACSVLYFFCAALAPGRSFKLTLTDSRAPIVSARDTVAALAELESRSHTGNLLERTWGTRFARAARDQTKLSTAVADAVPKAMFVLLPTFAALFALSFRDRRRRYPQHLAFTLHVHAVLFLGLTVFLVSRATTLPIRAPLALLVGGLLGAYLLKATHRVYQGTIPGVLARLVVVFLGYGVALAATMVAIFVLIVLSS